MTDECDQCQRPLPDGVDKQDLPQIQFAYKTFYFCSEKCAEEYAQ